MKRIVILLSILVISSLVIFIGTFITIDRTKFNNDFIRIFPSHVTEAICFVKFSKNEYSLTGLSSDNIFLRSKYDRTKIKILSLDMQDSSIISLPGLPTQEVTVDSPYFFVHDGQNGALQRGNIQDWILDTTFTRIPGFTAVQPMSPSVVALRTINIGRRKNVFVKSNSPDIYVDVLKKQVDGILCTDGYLQFSNTNKLLVYTYRYRNKYLVMDTSFNICFEGNTIDTTSVSKITVSEADGKISMAKPPLIVNKFSCVDEDYLFVCSNLVASNETPSDVEFHSVVDVYKILDGSYKFSFYIENVRGSKMQSFKVKDGVLLALFPDRLIRYEIQRNYLTN